MTTPITIVSPKESLSITHGDRSWSEEREPKDRSPMGGERASSFRSNEQLMDISQSTIHMTFAGGCHFGYSFYWNAV